MSHKNHNNLINRYFIGTISALDMKRLDALLQDDPNLRQAFGKAARMDANLREAALQTEYKDDKPHIHISRFPWGWQATAAALVLAVFLLLWQQHGDKGSSHIARVVEVHGSLRWTGDGGEVKNELTKGLVLSGGTLESLSADSWVEIAFHDGSQLALSGQSLMIFSKNYTGQMIRLREGSLSAEVAPQQDSKAMRFITPTAEARVLGTQLTLRADSSSTRLMVYEGRVQVTRLADGSAQEVPADHFIVAKLDIGESFQVQPREQYVDSWKSNLPYGIVHGKWHSAQQGESGYLEAKPLLWKEYGKHMVLDLASFSAIDQRQQTALLQNRARIRIIGRLSEDFEVHFGLTTHRVGGGFAGKYIASRHLDGSTHPFEIDLPITAFHRQYASFPESLIGHELVDWWALTINQEAGLEILSVELFTP